MMMRLISGLLLGSLLFLITGCGPNNAKGIPKLYPVTVKVTSSDQPLADVMVTFAGSDGLSMGGTTDATGSAVISTKRSTFMKEGAPKGEYKVILSEKKPSVPTLSIEEKESMTDAQKKAHAQKVENANKNWKSQVPKQVTTFDKTPLKATVAENPENNITFELKDYTK